MRCSICQHDNREGVRFCEQCGASLGMVCPSCRARIPSGSSFCGECGRGLAEPKPPAFADYSRPSSYTPRHLADKILAARAGMEGERKQVTVLFADVRGFTSISEKLDPEDVHDLIGECMVFLTEEIHRYEGTIAQFLGDGAMALFGAPIAHEDAPRRALHAALAIRERLKEYSEKLKKRGTDFNMRIGLNTGLVVVGRIGDDLTMEYTAMGDTVNLASRMESTAEPGTIQVSENTYRLTEGYFEFKPLGQMQVKGKKEPVRAYQVLSVGRVKTRLGISEMRGLTPFVGRQKELDHLVDCYERAKEGQGQVVGIAGEAGVGKSRLLLQLRSLLPEVEYTYLEGQCLHYGEPIAYLPVLNILRSYFGIEEGEPEALSQRKLKQKMSQIDERLMAIVPPLQELLSLKTEDEAYASLDPQQKRARTFEAISSLLIRESQNRPLVLAVEDIQWIDKTSEEFLGYLVARLGGAHVMLLLLHRLEYSSPWAGNPCYSQIRLEQFTSETTAEMVQAILKERKAAQELVKLITDRASGNPLFTEELTRSLLERGYIERKDGHYVLAVKPRDIQVPETVQGIIGARIDRLEERLKHTVQVASVIGREFPLKILRAVAVTHGELETCLSELQDLDLIHEKSVLPEVQYVFKHALVQETTYNTLLIKKRKEIHGRVARAIETLYSDRLEEFCEVLAYHYSKSDDLERTCYYLRASGDKASRNYSTWEAFHFYSEAWNALKRLPDTERNRRERMEVLWMMPSLIFAMGYPESCIEILGEGQELATELGDERSLARLYGQTGHYYLYRGDALQAVEYAAKAFQEAEKLRDAALVADVSLDLIAIHIGVGNASAVADTATRAISLVEATKAVSVDDTLRGLDEYSGLTSLYAAYGWAKAFMGDFSAGETYLEKARSFGLRVQQRYNLAVAELLGGLASIVKGDGDKTLQWFLDARSHCEEAQMVAFLGAAWAGAGWAYYLQSRFDAARECGERAVQIQGDAGVSSLLSMPKLLLGQVSLESSEFGKARGLTEEALSLSRVNNEKWSEGWGKIWLGRILGKADISQAALAQETILEGMRIVDELRLKPLHAQGLLWLGELYAETGQNDKALASLIESRDLFSQMGMNYWLDRTNRVLQRVNP